MHYAPGDTVDVTDGCDHFYGAVVERVADGLVLLRLTHDGFLITQEKALRPVSA